MTSFADLSHHNAPVDLAAYKAAGHDRVVLKATEGTFFVDPTFTTRWKQAKQVGLARVAYHFARAKFNGADEFDHFLSVVNAAGGLGPRDRLCLDVEDSDTPNRAGANAREFAARAVQRGVMTGLVYSYRYYMINHAVAPSQFPPGWRQLWLADYTAGQADTAIELGAGWDRSQVVARQYTDKATFAGVNGTCDGNRVVKDWLAAPAPHTPTPEESMALSDADKGWLRELTGAGGGTTVVGVVQQVYNLLHADLAELQSELEAVKAQLPAAQPPTV
jgi:lysozyme